ncbi:hypothetical protein BS47DRAFT_1340255 [Hydnum rufescens UP504]|uniref:Secreted protein n=1 Tax=Hydnum rufescens UP504 TaxID=1448309 RepID=A0A9P6B3L5_9AGAM|nr:hypothetical protein BS47DRAFT_1340255 [Hydnum rufescens UP504]
MKLAHSLALLVVTAFTMHSALANFHVVQLVKGAGYTQGVIACPSNYLNCNCFAKKERGADIGLQNFPDDFFSTKQNLCGEGVMNFYNRGGGHWEFFQKDGDSKPLGNCWTPDNPPHWKCGSTPTSPGAVTKLICNSYICGS